MILIEPPPVMIWYTDYLSNPDFYWHHCWCSYRSSLYGPDVSQILCPYCSLEFKKPVHFSFFNIWDDGRDR